MDLTKDQKRAMCQLFDLVDKPNHDIKNLTDSLILHLLHLTDCFNQKSQNANFQNAFNIIKKQFKKKLNETSIKEIIYYAAQKDGCHLIYFIFNCYGKTLLLEANKNGNTLLHQICSNSVQSNLKPFDLIFKEISKKELDRPNNKGKTPLFLIIQTIIHQKMSDHGLIQLFVKYGCDLFKKNKKNTTPFDLIFKAKDAEKQISLLWDVLITPDTKYRMTNYTDDRKTEYEEYVKKQFDRLDNKAKTIICNEYYHNIQNLHECIKQPNRKPQTLFDNYTYEFIKSQLLFVGCNHINK